MFQDFKPYDEFDAETLSTLHKIGEGLGRNVYALDEKHCIKYPRYEEGISECQNEASIYQQADKKFQKGLCPIVLDGKGYVVMRKAIPVEYVRVTDPIYRYTKSRNVKKLIDYLVERFNLYRPDLEKVAQWGYVDNKLVLLDYGRNMEMMKGCHID